MFHRFFLTTISPVFSTVPTRFLRSSADYPSVERRRGAFSHCHTVLQRDLLQVYSLRYSIAHCNISFVILIKFTTHTSLWQVCFFHNPFSLLRYKKILKTIEDRFEEGKFQVYWNNTRDKVRDACDARIKSCFYLLHIELFVVHFFFFAQKENTECDQTKKDNRIKNSMLSIPKWPKIFFFKFEARNWPIFSISGVAAFSHECAAMKWHSECTQDVAFNAHVSKNTIQWTLSNIDHLWHRPSFHRHHVFDPWV